VGNDILGPLVKAAIDAYIATLTGAEKADWTDARRTALLKAMFNPVEDWHENRIVMSDSDLTLSDLEYGTTRILFPESGITANRKVTLPTLADNQGKIIIVDNRNTTYTLNIDGEGSETINGKTDITLMKEWVKIDNNTSGWNTYERSDNYYSIPESDRVRTLDGVTGSGTFADIDFGSLIFGNRIPSRLLIHARYNTNQAWQNIIFRKNGSSVSDSIVMPMSYIFSTSSPLQSSLQLIVDCDEDGIVEYRVGNTSGTQIVYVSLLGYWYE